MGFGFGDECAGGVEKMSWSLILATPPKVIREVLEKMEKEGKDGKNRNGIPKQPKNIH